MNANDPKPLPVWLDIALALAIGGLVVWSLPDFLAWIRGEPPVTAVAVQTPAHLVSCREPSTRFETLTIIVYRRGGWLMADCVPVGARSDYTGGVR